jgi:hypothetical protein
MHRSRRSLEEPGLGWARRHGLPLLSFSSRSWRAFPAATPPAL